MVNYLDITWMTEEMVQYAFENKIQAQLCLSFNLPYELQLPNKHFYFDVVNGMFELLPQKNRRIIISVEKKWNKNQAVALRHSTFELSAKGYTFSNSIIHIFIESFYDEIEAIQNIYNEKNDILVRDLMQSVMEYFVFKYNESMGGNHYIIPSCYDCSRIAFGYIKNNLDDWRIKENIIAILSLNGTKNDQGYKKEVIESLLNDNFSIWKLYFNKSKYNFLVYDYVDSIISAAISIESYFYYIIQEKVPIEEHRDFLGENEEFVPTHKIAKILWEKNYIDNKISKTKMSKLIMKILKPRNDIMHGRLQSPIGMREIANDVNLAIIEFYSLLEEIDTEL